MRKITKITSAAFHNNTPLKMSNTEVIVNDNRTELLLFGHVIAIKIGNKVSITNSGYFTSTTKERLNGLNNVSIHQRKGVWYLNNQEWNGKLTLV